MRLCELFEAKPAKKVVKSPAPHNFVAKNAQTSGKGKHKPTDAENIKRGKFRDLKHKNKEVDE